ncbi:MAG: TIGR02452 family protein, partial [Lachnospiraceae bacterium]|nr:TIGR02452 family protein [Lachnospiraceae bacterium]
MGRDENRAVFEDTAKLCKINPKLNASVQKSVENQKLFLETLVLPKINLTRYDTPAAVQVSAKRTFEAASAYRGRKTAVHNFASASNPGGGVARGANAQEECLCRCSGLYFCLNTGAMWEGFYTPHRSAHNPLHNDDIIYTPEVTVFKTDTANPEFMLETDWYNVDIITCAAPNLRPKPGNQYNSGDGTEAALISDLELLKLHEKRLRRILDVAVLNGVE